MKKVPFKFPKGGGNQHSQSSTTSLNHKHQHGMVTVRVQHWHAQLSSNQRFSNWTEELLSKRETMPGTKNLAGYSRAVKSQKKTYTATSLNKHTP